MTEKEKNLTECITLLSKKNTDILPGNTLCQHNDKQKIPARMSLVFDKICSVHDGNDTSSRMKDHLPVMIMTSNTVSFIAYHQDCKEL